MVNTLASQSALVAVIVALATTVALLLRSSRPVTVRYSVLAVAVAAYYGSVLGGAFGVDGVTMLRARLVASGVILIATTTFFDAILGEVSGLARRRRQMPLSIGAVAMFAGVTPAVSHAWVVVVVGVLVVGMLLLRVRSVIGRASTVDSRAERTRLRYLGIGGFIAVAGTLFDLANAVGYTTPAFGGIVVAVYLYFLSQAIMVSRLLDLHELVGKALVFTTLAALVAIVFGALRAWIGDGRGLFLSNTLVAASLILILFEPARARLEETATRIFYREQLNFSRAMRRVVRKLQTVIELPAAVAVALDDIYDSKRSTHASVYVLERDGMGFVRLAFRGPAPDKNLEARAHPIVFAHIMKERTPILRDAVARRLARGQQDALTDAGRSQSRPTSEEEAMLRALDALLSDILIPLRTPAGVAGLLCLRDERLPDAFASDEIAALIEVADQLAITTETSRLFGLLKERDRLAALGEMSAGLAHEIRNPLAAIKGAAQELDPSRIGGDDGELMQVIIDEVNRLNVVVSEFLDYARPFGGTFVPLSVNTSVKRTAQLMQHDLADVEMQLDLEEGLPDVLGDSERLQQVFINLVLNAADAMQRKGVLHLSTRHVSMSLPLTDATAARVSSVVEIRVRDSGPGIPAKVIDQIFIPFFTTKSRGTGLGLALCQRIVQHHGGSIEVHSVEAHSHDGHPQAGHGATFIIRLPGLPAPEVPSDTPASITTANRYSYDGGTAKART